VNKYRKGTSDNGFIVHKDFVSEQEHAHTFTEKQIKENIDLVVMYIEERVRQVREESEYLDENPKIASLNYTNMDQNDTCLTISLCFEEEEYSALVDTGAMHSCIWCNRVEKHEKQILPVKGNIQLADSSQTLP